MSRQPPLPADRANTPAGQSLLRAFERLCEIETGVTAVALALDPLTLAARVRGATQQLEKQDAATQSAIRVVSEPAVVGDPGDQGGVPGPTPKPGAPPSQTPPNVVKNPGSRLSVVQAVNAANPGLINQSCLAAGGNFEFLTKVVLELRKESPRWGFLCRNTDCGNSREDTVGYYAGLDLSNAQQSKVHYVFDIIVGHCPGPGDPAPTVSWNDVTAKGGPVQAQPNRWKYPR